MSSSRLPPGEGQGPGDDAPTLPEAGSLSVAELRDRSVRGVAAVVLRGVGVRSVGLVVSIVLARLLMPRDFGVLAFGTTFLVVGTFLTDGGLGAQLVRSPEPPTRHQLSSVLGFQLAVTLALLLVATALLLPGGHEHRVTAVMLWALLISTFRVPGSVQLERSLQFRSVAVAEVLDNTFYAVLAIGLVLAGAGVWGVAAATVLRPLAGATVLQRAADMTVLRPTLDWPTVAPLLPFGLAFQLSYVVVLVRDQGINLLTAAVGGTTALGYWSLAQRIMLVPFLLFESLWRVSYPTVARLLEAGHDVREDLSRALVLGSFLTGMVVVPLSVAAPALVPAVFGSRWEPMVPVVPLAAAGLLVSGPLSAVGAGYLTATGRLRVVILAQTATVVPWAVLLPLLLPSRGVTANGLAWLTASLVEALALGWALRRYAHVPALRSAGPTVLTALGAGAAGLAAVVGWHLSLVPAVGVVLLSTLAYLGLGLVVARSAIGDLWRVLARVLGRDASAAPAAG